MNIRRYFRNTLILLALVAVGPVVMAVQFVGVVSHYSDIRETAVKQWEASTPDGTAVVQRYRDACESRSDAPPEPAGRPISIVECAEKAGSASLVSALQEAEKTAEATLHVPAPLRWVIPKDKF